MSKIIRSRDLENEKFGSISSVIKEVQGPDTGRPKGGVSWLAGNGEEPRPKEPKGAYQQWLARDEELVTDARRHAQKTEEEQYHKGFTQGEAAGKKLAAQKVEPVLKSLGELMQALATEREQLIVRHDQDLIKIAFMIAMKILHSEIETNNEVVVGVVKAALEKVVKTESVIIKLSPYDLELLQQQIGEHGLETEWLAHEAKLEGDFNIARGGCKVQTDSGEIDATIETQLELIKSILWQS